MSIKSEKFIKNLDNFIDYYEKGKLKLPPVIKIKKEDRNLIWPVMSGDFYRGVKIDFVK